MSGQAGAGVVRAVIVDDHEDFRALMEVLLSRQPDIKLLAQAGSLAEARAMAARFELDVVILDLGLPDGSGADLNRRPAPGQRQGERVGLERQPRPRGHRGGEERRRRRDTGQAHPSGRSPRHGKAPGEHLSASEALFVRRKQAAHTAA